MCSRRWVFELCGHWAGGNGAGCGNPVAEFALQEFGSGGSKEASLDVRPFSVCTSLPSHVPRVDPHGLARRLWGLLRWESLGAAALTGRAPNSQIFRVLYQTGLF